AGGAANPWAALAAADVVRMLWQDASPDARRRVNMAIAGSDSVLLRSLPTHTMPTRPPVSPAPDTIGSGDAAARVRALVWLALIAFCTLGMWARAPRRLQPATD